MLTDAEWSALKTWRAANPALCAKIGTPRADGLVFGGWVRDCKCGEWWYTQAQHARHVAKMKECQARRRAADPAAANARAKAERQRRHAANPASYAAHLAERREYASRADVRARSTAGRRARYDSDPDFKARALAALNAWKRLNRSRVLATAKARKLLRQAQTHPEANHAAIREVYRAAVILGRLTGAKYHVDHIIPLKVGGWHHESNLQVLPRRVNLSKKRDPFWTSETFLDWRSVPAFLWPAALAPAYTRILRISQNRGSNP